MIKAIVFDFSGVISEEGYDNWLKKNTVDYKENNNRYLLIAKEGDKAVLPIEKYLSRLSKETGVQPKNIWPSMRKEFILRKDMISFILKLKENYKIGLLSNFPKGWLQIILKEEKIYNYFNAITISSELHIAKPDLRIFFDILNKLGILSDEAVFIDDKKENVIAANNIGIKGLLFTSLINLKKDFLKLNININ